jgi:hypothetical protein
VVIVQLRFLEQEVSRMSKYRQVECAMMTPGLGHVIGFVAHVLVLLSQIAALEQQLKPRQKSLNHGECKRIEVTYLFVPHCSHFNNMRLAWELRGFDFLVGVRSKAEE